MREHEHLESETVEETQFRLKREEVLDGQVATEQSVSLNDLLQLTQQRLAQSIKYDDPATIQQWQAVVRGQMELLQQERRARFKMWGGLGGMVVGAGICIFVNPFAGVALIGLAVSLLLGKDVEGKEIERVLKDTLEGGTEHE